MPKAAILGCGMIAGLFEDFSSPPVYSHAKAYVRHPAFTAIAVLDRDPDRAARLAAKAGAVIYDDLDRLLAEFRPDVVSLCTPDDHHFAALRQILSHPRAPALVFCEKPVCTTREQLAQLREMEGAGRTRVMVNHSRRFDTAHRALKSLVGPGGLGDFVQGHVDYYGGWRHLGVHVVDFLQFLLGCDYAPEATEYCCESRYADDPTLHVFGRFGAAPFRFTGFPEPYYQIVDIALMFTAGQIKITDFGNAIEVLRKTVNAENENVLVRDEAASGRGMVSPMANAAAAAAAYLADGDEAALRPYGLAEAARTMETLWKGSDLHAARSV